MRNRKALTALSAAAIMLGVLGTGSIAFAGGNSGEYSGGFVVPGNSAVNPAYHPGWLASRKGADAYAYVTPRTKTVRPAIVAPQEDNDGPEAGKD
jgi:hypothetical protein